MNDSQAGQETRGPRPTGGDRLTVAELRNLLRASPVPEDSYVLDGPPRDATYCLTRDGQGWVVYYAERGLFVEERRFDSEHDACADLLARLRRAFRVDVATAGPVGAGTDDVEPWPTWVRYPLIAAGAVVVAVGLVLAISTGADSAVWRIVIAAVAIPAILAPLRLMGRRRRAAREAGSDRSGQRG